MNKTLSIAVAVLTLAGTTTTFAAELPTYEANGIPASPVQVRVLGAAHIEQQVAAPATSMTAHQASVLTPRKQKTANVTTGSIR